MWVPTLGLAGDAATGVDYLTVLTHRPEFPKLGVLPVRVSGRFAALTRADGNGVRSRVVFFPAESGSAFLRP